MNKFDTLYKDILRKHGCLLSEQADSAEQASQTDPASTGYTVADIEKKDWDRAYNLYMNRPQRNKRSF